MLRSFLLCLLFVSWGRAGNAAPTVDGVVDGEYGAPLASDAAGDYATSSERKSQWDLVDLHVTHDQTFLYVAFSLLGSVDANIDEEKSLIFYVDTTGDQAGATSDAWVRQIVVGDPHKPEYSINSWIRGSAAYGIDNVELHSWVGSGWKAGAAQIAAAAAQADGGGTVLEWKIARSAIGDPQEIWVEVLSTGTFLSDNAQDTINAPADDWNAPTGSTQWTAPATVSNSTHYRLVVPADAGVDLDPADGSVDMGGGDSSVDVGSGDSNVDASTQDRGALVDARVDGAAVDTARDSASPDAAVPDQGSEADARPYVDAGVARGDGEGCGCAARGELAAEASLPLVLAFGIIGGRRRRR